MHPTDGYTLCANAIRGNRNLRILAIGLLALLITVPAFANNLVVNGDFETTTNGPNFQFDNNTVATGWTSTNNNNNAYNFIFAPGAADTTGATGQYRQPPTLGPKQRFQQWTCPRPAPPAGTLLARMALSRTERSQQTINGLTVNNSYTVSFWWAGAQQSGFTGATTEQWQVSLGNQTQSTVVVNNANHGFTGWISQSFTYTATNSSEVLSFFAVGTPNGVPPFVLLDGVTLNANSSVPEPGTLLPDG